MQPRWQKIEELLRKEFEMYFGEIGNSGAAWDIFVEMESCMDCNSDLNLSQLARDIDRLIKEEK